MSVRKRNSSRSVLFYWKGTIKAIPVYVQNNGPNAILQELGEAMQKDMILFITDENFLGPPSREKSKQKLGTPR